MQLSVGPGLLASATPPALLITKPAGTDLTVSSGAPAAISVQLQLGHPCEMLPEFPSSQVLAKQILMYSLLAQEGWITLQSLPTLAGARRFVLDYFTDLLTVSFPVLFCL